MASSIGSNIKLTIFGQSHSAAIGMTLEGLPAGIKIDFDKLEAFTSRRAPSKNAYSTARKEADKPEFISGIKDGVTCGAPLTAIIRNTDTRSNDYSELKILPRPGHADFTASVKYGGNQDYAGGGHFSGRLTAPLCLAGGIVLQILDSLGITVISRIASIGDVSDDGELLEATAQKPFPTVSDEKAEKMQECIASAKSEGDSVGGIVECKVLGLPVGLGDPMFDGMENKIANIVFGIPAVKGIEFGIGFEASKLRGSENNDPFEVRDGKVVTTTNNCGGILGGITTGMPVVFKVAFKPTPSISQKQHSVRLDTLTEGELVVKGRHDPCIVPRAVPCVEAAAAIAVYDAYLEYKKYI
ncbi:MAG: chorismate synthase [Oscillospiraceae bacterium]|nr:chorismate synthase [Oscillospiraceae bacterium]